jgi:CHAD domain-containing protein
MELQAETMYLAVAKYLDYYFRHFITNFGKARSEFDPEAIHQFRVSIKRIRAVFNAINKIYPGHPMPEEMLNSLREMFKAAAAARDLQVQLDLIKKLEKSKKTDFPLIKDLYHQQIEDSADEFLIRSGYLDMEMLENFSQRVREGLAGLNNNADIQNRLFQWLNHRMDKMRQQRHRVTDPCHLHRFRTKFKELSYIVELIYGSGLQPNIDKATFQKLKEIGQQLGNWHDHYQLWHKTGEIFHSATDIHLLEEAYRLKKFLTPLHNSLYNKMQNRMNEENLFTVNIL